MCMYIFEPSAGQLDDKVTRHTNCSMSDTPPGKKKARNPPAKPTRLTRPPEYHSHVSARWREVQHTEYMYITSGASPSSLSLAPSIPYNMPRRNRTPDINAARQTQRYRSGSSPPFAGASPISPTFFSVEKGNNGREQ
jgi:hypothetical protein